MKGRGGCGLSNALTFGSVGHPWASGTRRAGPPADRSLRVRPLTDDGPPGRRRGRACFERPPSPSRRTSSLGDTRRPVGQAGSRDARRIAVGADASWPRRSSPRADSVDGRNHPGPGVGRVVDVGPADRPALRGRRGVGRREQLDGSPTPRRRAGGRSRRTDVGHARRRRCRRAAATVGAISPSRPETAPDGARRGPGH